VFVCGGGFGVKRTTTAYLALFAFACRYKSASLRRDRNSRSSRPTHFRHAGPGLSISRRSPVFAASMTLPLPVQWLDHHQLRGAACLLRQALAFPPLGKLLRTTPMGPVQRFDHRITAFAETQGLAPRGCARHNSSRSQTSLVRPAQDRNSFMASDIRDRLVWTVRSR